MTKVGFCPTTPTAFLYGSRPIIGRSRVIMNA